MFNWLRRKKLLVANAILVGLLVSLLGIQVQVADRQDSVGYSVKIGVGDERVITLGSAVHAAGSVDYTYDGVDDDVQFQAALDTLPVTGGRLVDVSAVQKNFSATVTRAIPDVTIVGSGAGSYFTNDGATAIFTAGGNGWHFENLRTDAGGINMGATTAGLWTNVTIDTQLYTYYAPTIGIGSVFDLTAEDSLTVSSLTNGRVPYAGASGLLGDSTNLTFDGTSLQVSGANVTRSATYVVASSDAPAHVKAQADYVCDGTADDVEIQAAIDALPAGGGKVVLSEGIFNVNAGITIGDNTHIEGLGWNTILRVVPSTFPDNVSVLKFNLASKSKISNLHIDGEWDNGRIDNDHGIEFAGTTDCSVDSVYIEQCRGQGIVTSSATRGIISNYISYRNEHRGINVGSTSSYFTISDCIAIDNYRSGFLVGSPGIPSHHIEFVNCIGYQTSKDNIGGVFDVGVGSDYVKFTNCSAYYGGTYGFVLSGNYGGAVNCSAEYCASHGFKLNGKDTLVQSCVAFSNGGNGFAVESHQVKVVNCISERNKDYGVRLYTNIQRSLISGNTVKNNGQTAVAAYNGIYLEGASLYNIIQGNHCYDDQDSITSLLTSDAAAGQKVVNVADGTEFFAEQWVTISDDTPLSENNQIDTIATNALTMKTNLADTYTTAENAKVTGRKTQNFAIREVDTGDYNIIKNNNVVGNQQTLIPTVGANTIVQGNIGYVTENSGVATLLAGGTVVQVTHSLDVTPGEENISLTPLSTMGNTSYLYISDNATNMYFWVNADVDPTSTNITLGWGYSSN